MRWSEDVVEVRGLCCSVMLMGTMEPHCYQMREITAMALLFSDWSGCVNLLAPNWSTKTGKQSQCSVPRPASISKADVHRCRFCHREASASAIKLFSAMTGERMCSVVSSLKAKCLIWPLSLSPLVWLHACRELWNHPPPETAPTCAALCNVILKAGPYSEWLMRNHTGGLTGLNAWWIILTFRH